MILYDNQIGILNKYLDKLMFRKLLTVETGLDIVEALIEYINEPYKNDTDNYDKLINILWKEDTNHINEIFQGHGYG